MHNRSTWFCIENIPAFRLAETPMLMLGCIAVIRMDLHRELRIGIDKLDQQRKATTVDRQSLLAKQCRSQFLNQHAKSLACVWLILGHCLAFGFPCFADQHLPNGKYLPSRAFPPAPTPHG